MNWESTGRAVERGPYSAFWAVFVFCVVAAAAIGTAGTIFSWWGESKKVVQQEFGPSALLRKYEWFKDAAATLDKKQADIGVYQSRAKSAAKLYGEPAKWPRDVREQQAVWASEAAGVTASYNSLAAEYNAGMAKFNWAFANVGQLPQGAAVPLPREFKPYLSE